jgi:hypothetical protein
MSVATMAAALRSFFKRLAIQGLFGVQLADAIRGPRLPFNIIALWLGH